MTLFKLFILSDCEIHYSPNGMIILYPFNYNLILVTYLQESKKERRFRRNIYTVPTRPKRTIPHMLRQESRVKLRRDSAVSSQKSNREGRRSTEGSQIGQEETTSLMSLPSYSLRGSVNEENLSEKTNRDSLKGDIPRILVHKTISRDETLESSISDTPSVN